jgi:hypothetical protein
MRYSNVCGTYIDVNGLANGAIIQVEYEIIIPMTTFKLLARLRCLPTFFGTWKIELVPTLENMVSKIISYDAGANKILQTSCKHVNRELAFQFYNVNTHNYYVQATAGDPITHWIQFAPEHYVIEETYF